MPTTGWLGWVYEGPTTERCYLDSPVPVRLGDPVLGASVQKQMGEGRG